MISNQKKCSCCNKIKPLSEFHKDKNKSDGLCSSCKFCNNSRARKYYNLLVPWKKTYKIIFNRCNNKNYNEFIYYGGRGIKCLINVEELKILWFRDKAYDMDRPSIDRIDNDGNYTFENCRFIELSENVKKNKFKPILQFDVDGNFIARFKSAREADRLTGISYKKISSVLCGKQKQTYGFIWRFENHENQ
ncbi:MAG: NUMOD1 domain-containing DNA-binding protein [Candidatus Helarchaeota archaeon]